LQQLVQFASEKHAKPIALLHYQGLNQSFLRELGIPFLTSMYRFFINHELVYVYLEGEDVKGFISASLSTNKVMRRFISKSPTGIVNIIIAVLKKPQLIKSILETYKSPHTEQSGAPIDLPSVELLSIVVSDTARQGGVGTQLLSVLEAELQRLQVRKYKVVAGAKLIGANRFYLKNGFVKAVEIVIHGDDVSNVYVKELYR